MIVICCPIPSLFLRIHRAVGAADGAGVARDWREFDDHALSAASVVVALGRDLTTRDLVVRGARRDWFAAHPVLVVAPHPVSSIRISALGAPEATVAQHRLEVDLVPALTGVERLHRRRLESARRLERADVPPALRRALLLAVSRVPTPATVQELADLTATPLRTLQMQWRGTAAPRTARRLEDLLDWMRLLTAASLRASGECWDRTSERAGVHPHTVSRYARRLLDVSLAELAGLNADALWDEFAGRVLVPLLPGRST